MKRDNKLKIALCILDEMVIAQEAVIRTIERLENSKRYDMIALDSDELWRSKRSLKHAKDVLREMSNV